MKKEPVKVIAHPETGKVVTENPNKPGEGSVRFDQEVNTMEGGYYNKRKRTAFIGGKVEDLESLGLKAGQTMPGRIVQKESYEPFYDGQSAKINPTTNEVIQKNGKDVFFQFVYTERETEPDYEWVGVNDQQVSESVANALGAQTIGG